MTQTSAVIGTAQYLSPEQARGEQVDARSDLYSTGCLLYELLTGRPPFVGDSPVSVAYQHVREEPVPPSQVDPDVPPSVDAIVLKALAKDRDDRYQTADEMRARHRRRPRRPAGGRGAAAAGTTDPADPAHHRAARHHDDACRRVPQPPRRPQERAAAAGLRPARPGGARRLRHRRADRAARCSAAAAATTSPSRTSPASTVAEARSALQAEGLTLGEQTPKADDKVPEGNIIDQSPESGTQVDDGDPVVGHRVDRRRRSRRPVAGRALARRGPPGTEPRPASSSGNTEPGAPRTRTATRWSRVNPREAEVVPCEDQGRHHVRQRQQQGARRGRQGRRRRPRSISSRPASQVGSPQRRRSRPTPSRAPCIRQTPAPASRRLGSTVHPRRSPPRPPSPRPTRHPSRRPSASAGDRDSR